MIYEAKRNKINQDILTENRPSFLLSCRGTGRFSTTCCHGDIIDGPAAASALKPLDAVYQSALRFIMGDPFDSHNCILSNIAVRSSVALRRDIHLYLFLLKIPFWAFAILHDIQAGLHHKTLLTLPCKLENE